MNTPGGNTNATAELTISLMLNLQRNLQNGVNSLKNHKWERKNFVGEEVQGKVLGIVGFGAIGKAVAEKANGLGMQVIAFDPMLTIEQSGVEWVKEIEQIWTRSDIITFHTPLNKHTSNLLNKESISLCKNGFKVINCARGGLVNEKDLYEALDNKKCGGAVLDVFTQEPPKDELLKLIINHPNVICTPHLGASTEEAQTVVAEMIAHQISDALLLKVENHVVNSDGNLRKPNRIEFGSGPTKK